jgi:hypothetical protein
MSEAAFQTWFKKWYEHNDIGTAALELKIIKSGNFRMAQVAEHQISALWMAYKYGLFWKIPDEGLSRKPFDAFYMKGVPAYIVVLFVKSKEFYLIHINDFEKHRLRGNNVMTEEECAVLCNRRGFYGKQHPKL